MLLHSGNLKWRWWATHAWWRWREALEPTWWWWESRREYSRWRRRRGELAACSDRRWGW
jgi:hypothetical protein